MGSRGGRGPLQPAAGSARRAGGPPAAPCTEGSGAKCMLSRSAAMCSSTVRLKSEDWAKRCKGGGESGAGPAGSGRLGLAGAAVAVAGLLPPRPAKKPAFATKQAAQPPQGAPGSAAPRFCPTACPPPAPPAHCPAGRGAAAPAPRWGAAGRGGRGGAGWGGERGRAVSEGRGGHAAPPAHWCGEQKPSGAPSPLPLPLPLPAAGP